MKEIIDGTEIQHSYMNAGWTRRLHSLPALRHLMPAARFPQPERLVKALAEAL